MTDYNREGYKECSNCGLNDPVTRCLCRFVMSVLKSSLGVEYEGPHHACQDLGKLGGNDLWHHLWKLHFHGVCLDEGAQTEQVDLFHYLSEKETFMFILALIKVAIRWRHDITLLYSDLLGSVHRAWRPSVWWGGRIAVSWPPSPSPSCG